MIPINYALIALNLKFAPLTECLVPQVEARLSLRRQRPQHERGRGIMPEVS